MSRYYGIFIIFLLVLSACANDDSSEKEPPVENPESGNVQQSEDHVDLIKESGIESYVPSDAHNVKIEAIPLTGNKPSEVLAVYTINDDNGIFQSKIVVSQFNPSFDEWEIILNEDELGEYHHMEALGRLSVYDNKLEQPVFRLNAGGSGSPDWVAVLLYDEESKDFHFKSFGADYVYHGVSVLDDEKTIEFDGVTLKERFTWESDDFDHRILLKNPKVDKDVTHTIRYSFRDNGNYGSSYTSNVENNSVLPVKKGDTVALVREDIGEDIDILSAGEGLEEISPFYYKVIDPDKDCTISFRTETSDWITYSFVSN